MAFGGVDLTNPPTPLEPLTPATIVDPDQLATEIARVRRDGCAVAIDELEVGLSSLAAPVARRDAPPSPSPARRCAWTPSGWPTSVRR